MRYIETFREGMHVSDVYLCKNKQIQLTKNGKEYGNLVLQDKTGTIDAKIWDLNSPGVGDFDTMDYVCIEADVTLFQNSNHVLTHSQIYERIWQEPDYGEARKLVSHHVQAIRRKLNLKPDSGVYLRCIRDVGYSFERKK